MKKLIIILIGILLSATALAVDCNHDYDDNEDNVTAEPLDTPHYHINITHAPTPHGYNKSTINRLIADNAPDPYTREPITLVTNSNNKVYYSLVYKLNKLYKKAGYYINNTHNMVGRVERADRLQVALERENFVNIFNKYLKGEISNDGTNFKWQGIRFQIPPEYSNTYPYGMAIRNKSNHTFSARLVFKNEDGTFIGLRPDGAGLSRNMDKRTIFRVPQHF